MIRRTIWRRPPCWVDDGFDTDEEEDGAEFDGEFVDSGDDEAGVALFVTNATHTSSVERGDFDVTSHGVRAVVCLRAG